MHCPLCQHSSCKPFFQDKRREFLHCQHCDLVFVPASQHLQASDEKREYDLHQNLDNDTGYLKFLDRARAPLLKALSPPAVGLDYGSGPNPVLANWLQKDGYEMQYFDPFYAPTPVTPPDTGFDFIISTEAIEHFHVPHKEWSKWMEWLAPNGIIIIMTKRWIDQQRFSQWHYKNDLTHVCFFHVNTFQYLADQHGLQLSVVSNDVVMMQRGR